MTAPEYIQLKAFARMDGAWLALLWTVSFACLIMGFSTPGLGMVAEILMIATPFFVARRLKKFRDWGLEGIISFKRGWGYCLLTFFYGSLLFAAAQFIYFSYLDHGYFMSMLTKMMTAPEVAQAFGKEMMSGISEGLQVLGHSRPIDLALNIMMNNIIIGMLLSFPVAAVMKREVRKIEN